MKKLYTLFICKCFLIITFSSNGQIISKVAGGNGCGSSSCGDGGPATNAGLSFPKGVFVDGPGNIYIADFGNHKIRKVNTSGIISTIAGTGTGGYTGDGGLATAAKLNNPQDVVVDAAGNVYIADNNNSVIRKINTSGIISTFTPAFTIYGAMGLDIDASGNIYVTNGGGKVFKVTSAGVITTIAGSGTGGGTTGFSGDGGLATAATLNAPYGVAIDNTGNIYIADYSNNRIRKVNTSGIISTFAGTGAIGMAGDGGLATSAQIHQPVGIEVDATGNVYVSTNYFNESKVRKINPSGIITTYSGNGPSTYTNIPGPANNCQLGGPNRLRLDATGNLYIADLNNILKVCEQTAIVAGYVTDSLSAPITAGKVYAFKRQLSHAGLKDTLGSVTISSTGYYQFPNTIGNNYLVKAIADPILYPKAVDTYYGSKKNRYEWDSSSVVFFDPCTISTIVGDNIIIKQINPSTGPGTISGQLTTGLKFGMKASGTTNITSNPISHIGISVGKKPNGTIVATTTTSATGGYTLTNLPIGAYWIFVDIPNFPMDSLHSVNITSTNNTITNLNFYADSAKIRMGTFTGFDELNNENINVTLFPNPAKDLLSIKCKTISGKLLVRITDILGAEIKNELLHLKDDFATLNVNDLNEGIYFIQTKTEEGVHTQKIIISH